MRLHEYQAKDIFADAGIPVPNSRLADSVAGVLDAVSTVGYPAAIKAQVHVGGRGKAGGIKIATSDEEARDAAASILGMDLKGYTVDRVLVEEGVDFVDEYYVGVTMDRGAGEPVAMVSTKGGVDIEAVAEDDSEAIAQEHIDPAFGLHPYQARKVNIDEDALFRQPDLAEMEEDSYQNDLERKAGEYGFDYVRLSGNTGIIGNGAGLVMATLDLVDYYGGTPANFLDVGGGAKADRIGNALDMVFADENVDSVVFNIFGGITRGDEVAKGINEALEGFEEIPKPVVVRLAGTNAEEGMEILNTDLVQVEATLEDAVQRAVANAEEVAQ